MANAEHPAMLRQGVANCNVPRNACFTGRVEDLEALGRILLEQGGAAGLGQTAAVLPGLGGLGKSALALEFARRRAGDFRGGVFWLNAQTQDTLVGDLVDCGQCMGLHPWPQTQPEQLGAALRAWAANLHTRRRLMGRGT